MIWLIGATQWLHVLSGIIWFGGTLYINLILIPALLPWPQEKQREVAAQVGPMTTRVLRPAAILTIALGFVRGTFLGQLHNVQDVLGTSYGVTWLVALVGTLTLYGFIETLLDPAVKRLNTATSDVEYAAALGRVKAYAGLQIFGFLAIFTCMILLRFGI